VPTKNNVHHNACIKGTHIMLSVVPDNLAAGLKPKSKK